MVDGALGHIVNSVASLSKLLSLINNIAHKSMC